MRPLKLTARSEGRNDRHARIGVFQNDGKAGVLTVEAEQEGAVLAAINSHAALIHACRVAKYVLDTADRQIAGGPANAICIWHRIAPIDAVRLEILFRDALAAAGETK